MENKIIAEKGTFEYNDKEYSVTICSLRLVVLSIRLTKF